MAFELKLDVNWRLGVNETLLVPDLLFYLLEQIDTHGSISAAARHCDVSYRNAWNLLNRWQDQLGMPLITTGKGRGATLDVLGRKLLWGYRYAREQAEPSLQAVGKRVLEELQQITGKRSEQDVRIYASHCPSHPIFCRLMECTSCLKPQIIHGGSARCLAHLNAGDCTLAGFHLAEGPLAKGFMQHYLRYFSPVGFRVIEAVRRRQGLIIKPGNPRKIHSVQDLTRQDLQFINRQENSGTRMLLDLLLNSQSIDKADIRGYENIEFTHSAVSAMVCGGRVDVGVGTEAAAAEFGLDFIPLASEVYYYAVRRSEWQHPAVKAIRTLLSGNPWRDAISVMDGFDASGAGAILDAEKLIMHVPPREPS